MPLKRDGQVDSGSDATEACIFLPKDVIEQQVAAQRTPAAVYIPQDCKLPEFGGCSTKQWDLSTEEWVAAMKSACKVMKVTVEDRTELVRQFGALLCWWARTILTSKKFLAGRRLDQNHRLRNSALPVNTHAV